MKKELRLSAIAGLLLGIMRCIWAFYFSSCDTAAWLEIILIAAIVYFVFSRRNIKHLMLELVIFLLICSIGKILIFSLVGLLNIEVLNGSAFADASVYALEIELYFVGLIVGGIATLFKRLLAKD